MCVCVCCGGGGGDDDDGRRSIGQKERDFVAPFQQLTTTRTAIL